MYMHYYHYYYYNSRVSVGHMFLKLKSFVRLKPKDIHVTSRKLKKAEIPREVFP